MKIYFAGDAGMMKREIRWKQLISNRLLSYFIIKSWNGEKTQLYLKKEKGE